MMNSYLRVFIAITSIIFLLNQSFSQNNTTDLSGYQDFKWGMSRKDVESVLRKNKVSIKSSKKEEIIVNSEIELEGYSNTVNITKSFYFSSNSLKSVVLSCLSSSNHYYSADSIFYQFLRQLKNKYGNPYYDTTSISEYFTWRMSAWQFHQGSIMIESYKLSLSLDEILELKLLLQKTLEGVKICYSKNASEKEVLERKKRILKEF